MKPAITVNGERNTAKVKMKKTNRLDPNWKYGYIFILPTVGGFIIFGLIPTLAVFLLSLFKWDLLTAPEFVSFRNFQDMFSNKEFWASMKTTFEYVLLNLPAQVVLSMLLALALWRGLPGSKVYRVLFLIPWVTTPVAVSVVWKWIFNPSTGIANHLLNLVGMDSVNWFSSNMALKTVAFVNIWQFTGFTTLLLLVGLQNIPKTYFEAAMIDGASKWRTFWSVTLPLVQPSLMYVLVTGFIGSFQIFDTIFIMTNGGPGDSTKVLYYEIYQQGFEFLNMGYASALSVVLFVILMIVTLVQFKLFKNNTYDMS